MQQNPTAGLPGLTQDPALQAQPSLPAQGALEDPEQDVDPELQAQYEAMHHQMNLIIDQPEIFQGTRKMLSEAQQSGMLVEQAAMTVVHILNRLESEVGEIDDGILMALGEDLVTGVSDRFGLEVSPEDEERIMAAALGLWMKEHEQRVDISPEERAMLEQQALQEVGAQGQGHEGGPPVSRGLLGGIQ